LTCIPAGELVTLAPRGTTAPRWRLVFSGGIELTLLMRGIIDGHRFDERVRNVRSGLVRPGAGDPRHDQPLNAFLSRALKAGC
jgi:hypothetical protein